MALRKTKVYVSANAISLFNEEGKHRPPYYKGALTDTIMKNTKHSTVSYKFTNKVVNGPYYNLNRFLTYLRQNNYGRWVTPEPRPIDVNNFDFRPYVNMAGGDELLVESASTVYPSVDYFIMDYIRKNIPYILSETYTIISAVPNPSTAGTVVIRSRSGQFSIPVPAYDPSEQYLFMFYQSINNSTNHKNTETTYEEVPIFEEPGLDFVLISSEQSTVPIEYQDVVQTSRKYINNPDLDEMDESEIEDILLDFEIIREEWKKVEDIKSGDDVIDTLTTTIIHTTNYALEPETTTETVEGEELVNGVLEKYEDTISTVKNRIDLIRYKEVTKETFSNKSVALVGSLIYKRNSGKPGLDVLFSNRERTGFIPKLMMLKYENHYYDPRNTSDSIAQFNKIGLKRWFRKDSVYRGLIDELTKGEARDINNMTIYPCIDIGDTNKGLLLYMFNAGKYLIEKYNIKPDQPFKQAPLYNQIRKGFNYSYPLAGYVDRPNLIYENKGISTSFESTDYTDGDFSLMGDNLSYVFPAKYVKHHIGDGFYNHNGRSLRSGEIVKVNPTQEVNQGLVTISGGDDDNGNFKFNTVLQIANILPEPMLLAMPYYELQRRQGAKALHAWSLVYQVNDNRWERIEVWLGGQPMVRYNDFHSNMDIHPPIKSEGMISYPLPIIQDVLQRMPIIYANDVAQFSQYAITHSYKKVKKKWYQSGIFKVVVVVISVVFAVLTQGASLGASVGILGSNAAIGAALGLTGMTAAIVGAVVNTVAAMIVANLVSSLAGKMFGNKLGQILSMAAVYLIANWENLTGGSFNLSEKFNDMMNIENLMKGTMSIVEGISEDLNTKTANMVLNSQQELEALQEQERDILKQMNTMFSSKQTLDPLHMSEYTSATNVDMEPSSMFLSRTLMTGTELIAMQLSMIEDFVDINLDLKTSIDPTV